MSKNSGANSDAWLPLWCAGGILLGCIGGCSDSDAGLSGLVPVSGEVTFKGRPLTTGQVIFRPDPKKGNSLLYEPRGGIDEEGRFELSINGTKGVPPGWYQVLVVAREPFDLSKPYVLPKTLIPLKYSNPKTSGIAVQVVEGPTPKTYDLKLNP